MYKVPAVPPSEITPRTIYADRRRFMAGGAALALAGALPGSPAAAATAKLGPLTKSPLSVSEAETLHKHATSYNNFYEFGTDKTDPAQNAHALRVRPWSIQIDGLVKKPQTIGIDDLLKLAPLEERIYRLRCVEGWSMVIPWAGYPLSAVLKRAEPLGNAKYVEFHSVIQPDTMPDLRRNVLDWPYVEGLRMDEALHPLTLLALGMYGDLLPNQNGAPVRVVVPWKYGFKSAKSIVRIRLTEQQPATSWWKAAPQEYGFFSNVNPAVDHPRWSQARERRIGEFGKRDTLPFNGYGEQVAGLYVGMDLRKFF